MNGSSSNQDTVFAFLGDPATHGGREVTRIDTHAAVVFLAGERVLKVKRAVRFPFLDYSTLERRHAALLAELDVNRDFAPQIYLRVLPITRRADGGLEIDGGGTVVEWALEMRRFDENRTLDRLADRGEIDDGLAERLAAAVVVMHERAPPIEAESWIAAVEVYIEQNSEAFRAIPELFAAKSAERIDQASRAALTRLRPLLLARGRAGRIRRGHGDLHLGNIALIGDAPVPFDAIEFDPLVAAGDVLYDLAFLLMDLVERRLGRAANIVFNGYFSRTRQAEDLDGLAALPLFLSLRAAIRAKVTAARIAHVDAGQRDDVAALARGYFELAARLIAPPPPTLIAVGGLSGTGKSRLARDLAPEIAPDPGALVLRSDVERKRRFGVAETERLPAEAYRPEVSAAVYQALAQQAARVIAAGHSAIVDAVFARAEERRAIAAVAAEAGVRFCGLFLVADLATRIARVGARTGDASDADAAVARQQEEYRLGAIEWAEVDASGSPEQTLERARDALNRVQT